MAIEATMAELLEAEQALARIGAVVRSAQTSYHIAKLARLVRAETKHFHERREALIKELGEERDPTADEAKSGATGKVTSVTSANLDAFTKGVRELADVKASIEWRPLTLEQLGEVSANDLLALGPLVAEVE